MGPHPATSKKPRFTTLQVHAIARKSLAQSNFSERPKALCPPRGRLERLVVAAKIAGLLAHQLEVGIHHHVH